MARQGRAVLNTAVCAIKIIRIIMFIKRYSILSMLYGMEHSLKTQLVSEALHTADDLHWISGLSLADCKSGYNKTCREQQRGTTAALSTNIWRN